MGGIRVGVVGVGHLGKHHVRLLAGHPRANLVGIADSDAEALAASVELHGVRGYSDFRAPDGGIGARR